MAQRSRNQFLIFSVGELERSTINSDLGLREGPSSMNSTSDHPAVTCTSDLQRAAPKTIKEIIKKNAGAENKMLEGATCFSKDKRNHLTKMDAGEFERRIVKVFEREGYGYEGLIALPSGELERVHTELLTGLLPFSQAVGELLRKYRSLFGEP